jgi:hypothetical protein
MALLAWVKSKQAFLKIQEGTGDNLSQADIDAGMVDYVLWSVFKPECIDLDEELPLEYLRGGMLMDSEPITAKSALSACLKVAFEDEIDLADVLVLLNDPAT